MSHRAFARPALLLYFLAGAGTAYLIGRPERGCRTCATPASPAMSAPLEPSPPPHPPAVAALPGPVNRHRFRLMDHPTALKWLRSQPAGRVRR